MNAQMPPVHWRAHVAISVAAMIVVLLSAGLTGLWVLTAIPIGFVFGFLLQKGDLCGASACSEVLLMKDWRKLGGLWVAIVVSMAAFAVVQAMGWAPLRPKPFYPLNHVIGGVVFGIGIVLAGGCVTGSLFKAGAGNLNSMVALVAIPLGVGMIEYGPLQSAKKAMMRVAVDATDGVALSLPAITGLPFGALALVFGLLTLVVALLIRRRKRRDGRESTGDGSRPGRWLTRPWKPWQAGVAIGILGAPALVSSTASGRPYPLGVTHGVLDVHLLIVDRGFNHRWRQEPPPAAVTTGPSLDKGAAPTRGASAQPQGKKIIWWLVALVVSMIPGSWTSARLAGRARLLPKPPEQMLIAFLGGILVGVGAAIGRGCVTGNILSGSALMSVGSMVFGVVTVLAAWATTYVYLMGGLVRRGR